MKCFDECIPCLYRQVDSIFRLINSTDKEKECLKTEVDYLIENSDKNLSPPEIVGKIYSLIKSKIGDIDFYREIKDKSNAAALSVYDTLKNKVRDSEDTLLAAVVMSISGNIIDFGAKYYVDIDAEINKILNRKYSLELIESKCFHYIQFKELVSSAKQIVYLADNAGETVFDRILIEEIKKLYPHIIIIYAVKEKPIINDATRIDAVNSGIEQSAEIVSSGSVIPGTIIELCNSQFIDEYNKADLIISKGQGNFESLEDASKKIIYLFIAKCPKIASISGNFIGSMNILIH
ncbi:MAG: hypothetical protein A2015_11020 [Spirochaetes bacterium GWF1_31_7]|nr:MAG: hypothetical protein A2Y30_13155 [Spirochaetes bacterium GWE1_32_154]OHD48389.1 MAG: hypothetical protein A2015_11020 [Spirochaetes bacterium GWF1_31_7]OHD50482.1 MAG: hypothetical protein A2Y29_11200 [Spirochaetes bacterium GWE2_31_10]HBD93241.1 hypothetical protein [Spirochaetia bacterium]HBI38373.1 hypothetical protein [Spirochaetia bacterium]